MATESRQQGTVVDQSPAGSGEQVLCALMQDEPFRFRFFQMVRLLEKHYPERQPVGMFVSPADEVVRFSATPTLTFPASELEAYVPAGAGPASLAVNFLGLNAVNGPMPRSHTEDLLERKRAKDRAALDFFDLFNHRVVSLFYRAWRRYRLHIAYENSGGGEGEITDRLYDLVGLGTPWLRERMAIPDESTVYYSGLLSTQVRSVQGLQQILEGYFDVRVEIQQFTGCWVKLSREQQTVLRESQSVTECLGRGAVVGEEVWDQEGSVTVRLGPMPLSRYRDFLPGTRGHAELSAWLKFYSRRAFDFVVQLVLERDEVPRVALKTGVSFHGRLGYETWLKNKPMQRDPDETTYLVR